MKTYIYKLLITLILSYIFFEVTIGSRMDYFAGKIDAFSDHQTRLEIKEKLKRELQKVRLCWLVIHIITTNKKRNGEDIGENPL